MAPALLALAVTLIGIAFATLRHRRGPHWLAVGVFAACAGGALLGGSLAMLATGAGG